MTAAPPLSDGAVHVSDSTVSPIAIANPVGASANVAGTLLAGNEGELRPTEFIPQ